MIKLNIVGSIFGNDGYSSHTRSLFNALYKQKELDCKLVTQLSQDWMQNVNDAELDAITKPDRKEDWNVIVTIPHMWKMFLGKGKNACYCVWEGDKIPKGWIEEFMNPRVDLILVPSQHTKQAIINTLIEKEEEIVIKKLICIPHGVDRNIFYNQRKKDIDDAQNVSISRDTKYVQSKTIKAEQVSGNVETHADTDALTNSVQNVEAVSRIDGRQFKFICNKGWRGTAWDRGGVQYLLKAYAEEFSKGENVQLIIKLNPAYINSQIIEQSVKQLNLSEDRAPIHINSDILSTLKLNELYNSADCFVCATRGEAFNLPGLEAMSCGLPTIQTNFGGQVDYMNAENSLNIDYKLSESEEKPMYEGINWAVPDINGLRKQLRFAFEHKDIIKKMGKQAEEDSKNWTWDNSANKLYKNISEHNGTNK